MVDIQNIIFHSKTMKHTAVTQNIIWVLLKFILLNQSSQIQKCIDCIIRYIYNTWKDKNTGRVFARGCCWLEGFPT